MRPILSLFASPLFALAPLVAGCDPSPPVDAPTWHQEVAPLVAKHCASCHASGGVAPFDLVEYDDARPIAEWIATTVAARTMPPFGALDTDECAPRLPWRDDRRLSNEDIATFAAWSAAGAPEGDPRSADPLPAPRDLTLSPVDVVLAPEVGFVAAGDSDEFRCFVFDPELTETGWLVGAQLTPGNAAVVHHALVFSSPATSAAELDQRALDGGGSFECSAGNPAPDGSELIAAWAPGAEPMRPPVGTGMLVEAGSRIVMQIYYHPAGGVADPDITSLSVQWATDVPATRSSMTLLGNETSAPELQPGPNDGGEPRFFIPAGARGHTETIVYEGIDTGGLDIAIWAAGTHMHWVGIDMKIVLQHQDGTEECLVQTPKYDFNWQRWYEYDAPLLEVPVLRHGDTLVLRCTYDNSMENPLVRAAMLEQGLDAPVDVVLGESTLDEMCLGVFGIAYR